MMDDLGVEVPSDAMGPLQDVHWSMGKYCCDKHYNIPAVINDIITFLDSICRNCHMLKMLMLMMLSHYFISLILFVANISYTFSFRQVP